MEADYLIGVAALIVISAIGSWLATRRMKRKLEEGLGHKVKDEEVTSISAWMKVDEKVVDGVVHDGSLEGRVENAMENCFTNYAASKDNK